jgi:AraC-like DNA-binding protein
MMKLKYNFYAQTIIRILSLEGIEKEDIFGLEGIYLNAESFLESEISIEFLHQLTVLYKARMKTDYCGLEIINHIDFKNAGFIGPYAFSCATLDEAVQKIYTVQTKLNPLISYELIPSNGLYKFIYHLDQRWEASYPESASEIISFVIASGLLSSRSITQREIVPELLHLKFDYPKNLDLYHSIFKCHLYFGKDENCIAYPAHIMKYKIPSYNPTIQRILEDHAQKMIKESTREEDIISQVKSIIIKTGKGHRSKEEEVADALNISKRTLQKKLNLENTTFLKILEEIQMELAKSYLSSHQISNKEVSWMLGYNELSNFYRAFKRWTGMTPNEFRNKMIRRG